MISCFNEQHVVSELTAEEMDWIVDWFFERCMKQLLGAHPAVELRWDVNHWVFHNPFVSKKFGGTKMWTSLQQLVDVAAKHTPYEKLVSTECFYVNEPRAGILAASFAVNDDLQVVPFRFSFEDTCCRLGTDPCEMREHIRTQMQEQGIDALIDSNQMAVGSKNRCQAPQDDLLGFNYADPSMFIRPGSIPSFKKLIPDVEDSGMSTEFQGSLFNTVA